MPATYEKIATTTLGSAATSMSFSSIGATYTDLRIVWVGSFAAAGGSRLSITFNSDTGSNYSYTRLSGNGTAAASARNTNQPDVIMGVSDIPQNVIHLNEIDVFSYAGSTYKSLLIGQSSDNNGSGFVFRQVGLWRSTSAITSIQLKSYDATNINAGATATLYGILKA
jgi:hypothetical protein